MNKINQEQIRRNDALKVEIMAKGAPEQTATTIVADIEKRITANEQEHPYLYACNCGFESNNHCRCPACEDGFLVKSVRCRAKPGEANKDG